MLQRVYVVRHGETQWNQQFRLQGRLDSPLSELGKAQADANGKLLKQAGVSRLVVSPLGRTRATAAIINTHLDSSVEFADALIERDCGTWSGLTIDEVKALDPEDWQTRQTNEWQHRPPGGENLPDVMARVGPLLDRLVQGDGESVAIVSHGVVGKAILAHYLGLGQGAGGDIRQPNDVVYVCDFSRYRADDGAVSCEHFRNGEGPYPGLVRGAARLPGAEQ